MTDFAQQSWILDRVVWPEQHMLGTHADVGVADS